jgi:hypothetical protein
LFVLLRFGFYCIKVFAAFNLTLSITTFMTTIKIATCSFLALNACLRSILLSAAIVLNVHYAKVGAPCVVALQYTGNKQMNIRSRGCYFVNNVAYLCK